MHLATSPVAGELAFAMEGRGGIDLLVFTPDHEFNSIRDGCNDQELHSDGCNDQELHSDGSNDQGLHSDGCNDQGLHRDSCNDQELHSDGCSDHPHTGTSILHGAITSCLGCLATESLNNCLQSPLRSCLPPSLRPSLFLIAHSVVRFSLFCRYTRWATRPNTPHSQAPFSPTNYPIGCCKLLCSFDFQLPIEQKNLILPRFTH